MYPKHHARARSNNDEFASHAHNSDAYAFFNLLTGPELLDEVESLLPQHRERVFSPTETLSMFLAQALSADRSCQKAVNKTAIKRLAGGLPPCSTHTGAYCRARQRLPMEMVTTLVRHTGRRVTHARARAMALAGSSGAAGGRHDRGDAGHAGQSGRLSTTAQPEARPGVSLVPDGGHGVSRQRGGAQCGDRPLSGQGRR